jgi:glycosyltransferase involved in cell wall biosynthesis
MKLSVLLSVYGDENPGHFVEALISIWNLQTVKPAQIVIVKDGPLSGELEYEVSRWEKILGDVLTLIEFPVNRGLGAALNAGLEACKYDLVARMDSDDIAFSNRLEVQLEFLQANTDVDILGSYVEEMTEDGTALGVRKVPEGHESLIASLWACPLIHPTIMMRRSKVLLAGNYDTALRRRQDYELWFRCAEQGLRFHNLPQPLLHYRFGAYTLKKQSLNMALQQALIGYRGARRLRLPFFQRLACFIPFVRSLLPGSAQHFVYKILKPFDPRQRLK